MLADVVVWAGLSVCHLTSREAACLLLLIGQCERAAACRLAQCRIGGAMMRSCDARDVHGMATWRGDKGF